MVLSVNRVTNSNHELWFEMTQWFSIRNCYCVTLKQFDRRTYGQQSVDDQKLSLENLR